MGIIRLANFKASEFRFRGNFRGEMGKGVFGLY